MAIQSIKDSLLVILLQICRLEIDSARDSIEILVHRQLPQITLYIRLPDTGSEGSALTYPGRSVYGGMRELRVDPAHYGISRILVEG
jgi:hypothetical protein